MLLPVRGSQSFTEASLLPEANRPCTLQKVQRNFNNTYLSWSDLLPETEMQQQDDYYFCITRGLLRAKERKKRQRNFRLSVQQPIVRVAELLFMLIVRVQVGD